MFFQQTTRLCQARILFPVQPAAPDVGTTPYRRTSFSIKMPLINATQSVRFGLFCKLAVCQYLTWRYWAQDWLAGREEMAQARSHPSESRPLLGTIEQHLGPRRCRPARRRTSAWAGRSPAAPAPGGRRDGRTTRSAVDRDPAYTRRRSMVSSLAQAPDVVASRGHFFIDRTIAAPIVSQTGANYAPIISLCPQRDRIDRSVTCQNSRRSAPSAASRPRS